MSDVMTSALVVAKPPKRARKTAADRLRDALLALSEHRGQLLAQSERAWASITFAGARHGFILLFAGEDAVAAGERFIAVEHRLLPSPRLIVTCEVLLLEEG